MPRRDDIKKILLIGSGPIIIGQACEFDYSGTQACKVLREEGYEVVLVNSNPATIMTDPELSDRTYIEPLLPEFVEKIIEKERPQAVLPTLGGQTALNLAVALEKRGVFKKYDVEMIGADREAIEKAEDRDLFKSAMSRIGLDLPISGYAHSIEDAMIILEEVGLPAIIRPSFTLGGTGGNIAYNMEEYERYIKWGLDLSPSHEILVEESIIGWKEFELEVMRDRKDNVVIVCPIENFDPMGIHTGDSITVAPAMTLTDREYQEMRDASLAIIREIGVDTGGCNIQFGVHPETGRMVIIEMNPRVSRSSALASKATGFPIAKIAARLAVGYTLDEITNDITRETPACFEPTIDYVVVKVPRFTFEKFPNADQVLTTQMKSVGEVMAIGRTFKEALGKAISSLEIGSCGFEPRDVDENGIMEKLRVPNWERLWYLAEALRREIPMEQIHKLTGIDPWFLEQVAQLVRAEEWFTGKSLEDMTAEDLMVAKQAGFSDLRLGQLTGSEGKEVRRRRIAEGIRATFKTVDTCGAEFKAFTPYLYSTYESEDEAAPTDRKKVVILGGGPNRIGQGIEFDYCCVHGIFALADEGYETIMVNCNPETVSTDYDTSDRLYFEPLTLEHVLNIFEVEKPDGVIVQFGGQTPLKLALDLEAAGVPILGTSPEKIDLAEDRERFKDLLNGLGLRQPANDVATSFEEARQVAFEIGYPVVVRPSYVLGGRAMEIVHDDESLERYMTEAVSASSEHPVLIDKFVDHAIEVDVDAIADGNMVVIGGIMEHIEEAGVHSGDSACSLPPVTLEEVTVEEIARQTRLLGKALDVKGLMNVQFAVRNGEVFILEVNPRASRTVPFVSKVTGVPLANLAARIMIGKSLQDLRFTEQVVPEHVAVKEAVFPFIKFPGVDCLLGPEMRSTGEVMGIDADFPLAYAKAQLAAGVHMPLGGTALLSIKDRDKAAVAPIAAHLVEMGFTILATGGTQKFLGERGIPADFVRKVREGRPHVVDAIINGGVQLVINTVEGAKSIQDSYTIRRSAVDRNVAYFTTIPGARAVGLGIQALRKKDWDVKALQDYVY
ncbi:MAG: carbamoyl-phosphate synthase large subunit [Deltaproteobacteria bacterium]|nr:carbamoyl-phosphate synthase large subunit [Deltaproteobacteria bacterium]